LLSFLSYSVGDSCALPSFPTRRSSDLARLTGSCAGSPPRSKSHCAAMQPWPAATSCWAATGESVSASPPARPGGWSCAAAVAVRSEEHTSELQSRENLVCRLLLEKKTR